MRFVGQNVFKRVRAGRMMRKVAVFFTGGPSHDVKDIVTAMMEYRASNILPAVISLQNAPGILRAMEVGFSNQQLINWFDAQGCHHHNLPDVKEKSHILSVTTVFSLSCLHPDVCSLRHEAGGCRNYTLMWFFNSSRQRCSPFWYSGCGGNENRFKTQRECETVCVTPGGREDVISRKNKIVHVCVLLSAQCQLDADAGLQCEDYVQAWFYDKNIAACTPFWYGGCGGNANRFNTEHECFQTCGTNSKSCLLCLMFPVISVLSLSDDCVLVQDPGTCQNYTMMWFFDTEQNECSRFWYGGCGGNENRFKTQEECENLCLTKNLQKHCWTCFILKTLGLCFILKTLGLCFILKTLGLCFILKTLGLCFILKTL
uniref:BPTI/Kunitz inhibitor domain-containing protein n=1 Tax=Seriola lalandi dorsalis TaxID=1841481 RepID=A0A3B4X0D2_SERLL